MRRQESPAWRGYAGLVVMALAVAVFMVAFVAQPFVVEGSSMDPSLRQGERLIVSKLAYRFGRPERGDVIVFRYPVNRRVRFVKRVVGLPGETVAIRNGRVLVNGRPLAEAYLIDVTLGEFGPVRVPPGRLFVLGDNRANSRDSRYPEVGMISCRDVVGKAVAVYWPPALVGPIGGR